MIVALGPGQGSADVTPSTPVIAAVMPNVEGIESDPWIKYRTTLADVERQSGYGFLGAVPEAVRSELERVR